VEEKPAIVHETVHKKVIEEVTPEIHKETIQPHVVHVTQPMKERVLEEPQVIHEERPLEERKEGEISKETLMEEKSTEPESKVVA